MASGGKRTSVDLYFGPVNENGEASIIHSVTSPRKPKGVLGEIENLKQCRMDRRARQEDARAERERLKSLDPGNPQWEFSLMIREYLHKFNYAKLTAKDYLGDIFDTAIRVCIRKRPFNAKEIKAKEMDVVTIPSATEVLVHEPKTKVNLTKYLENQRFSFDSVFDSDVGNDMVYKMTAQPLVMSVFRGGMSTCFAYGQTGSGKTHTMGGDFGVGKSQDTQKGIYAMVARDIFMLLESPEFAGLGITLCCSFFEIYGGKMFDLLANKAKLEIMEDHKGVVNVVGLSEKAVYSVDNVLELIQRGSAARTSGKTSVNTYSSRSHAIFEIVLRLPNKKMHGKFSLVDLAGNERGADTNSSDRHTRMEGADINKSLLALKECIRALGFHGMHLPFRASKLTQVLRDSFIGANSRTCMIALISPGMNSCENSLNTLRYADRVKEIGCEVVEGAPTLPLLVRHNDPPKSAEEEFHDCLEGDENDDPEPTGEGDFVAETEVRLEESEEEDVNANRDVNILFLRDDQNKEIPKEVRAFHNIVSKVEEAEEEIVAAHRELIDMTVQWRNRDEELICRTHAVQYDQEEYVRDLEIFIDSKTAKFNELKVRIAKFRFLLKDEEKASLKMSMAALLPAPPAPKPTPPVTTRPFDRFNPVATLLPTPVPPMGRTTIRLHHRSMPSKITNRAPFR